MGDSNEKKGSLADQLAGLSISVRDEEQEQTAEEPAPKPAPLSDEELFARAMEGMSDEEVARAASRAAPKPDESKREKSTATLGEAFGSALADVKPVESKRRAPREPEPVAKPRAPEPTQPKPATDRELFEAAVDNLSADDVYRGKFFGHTDLPETDDGPSIADFMETRTADEDVEPLDEETARAEVKDLQNQRLLERTLGGIDKKVDSSKYRKKEPRGFSTETNEELNTEPLPKSGDGLSEVELKPQQRELLKRYNARARRSQVPELNLRGDTLDDALRRLELFAHDCWKRETGYIRVIHGKGNQSEGEPVLKPAVLRWLEGPGFRYVRGYAPEVKNVGNYGSIIVELARKK